MAAAECAGEQPASGVRRSHESSSIAADNCSQLEYKASTVCRDYS